MFDANVAEEGLGRADEVMAKERRGGSPDGLGAYLNPEPGDRFPAQAPPMQFPQPQSPQAPPAYSAMAGNPYMSAMAGNPYMSAPSDTSEGSALRSSGLTLLFLALSTGIGYAWKGGFGASAGLLLSAAVSNGYRAQKWYGSEDPSEKHEAIVSTVFGVGELAGGIYLAYLAAKGKKA